MIVLVKMIYCFIFVLEFKVLFIDLIKGYSSDMHLYLWSMLNFIMLSKHDGCTWDLGDFDLSRC